MGKYGDLLIAGLQEGGALDRGNALTPSLMSLQRELNTLWDNQQVISGWLQTGQSRLAPSAIDFPFVPIYSEVLASNTDSIHIDLPQTYKHLLIFGAGRGTKATTANVGFNATFNGDTGANYVREVMYGINATPGSATDTQNFVVVGALCNANQAAGKAGSFFAFVPGYRDSFHKTMHCFLRYPNEQTSAEFVVYGASRWTDTAAIASLDLFPDSDQIAAGSTISVYCLS